jgi:hypothetical protein
LSFDQTGFVTLTERPYSWFPTGKPTVGIAQREFYGGKKELKKTAAMVILD